MPACLDATAWHVLLRTWLALQQLGLAPAPAPAHDARAHAPTAHDARAPAAAPAAAATPHGQQHGQQHGAAASAAATLAAPAAAPALAAAERGAALCAAGETLQLLLADAAAAAQAQPAWRQQALQQLVRRAQPSLLLGGAAARLPVLEQAPH